MSHTSMCESHRGFSLVELLVAMTVGFFLLGGILSLYLSNKQTYRLNEAISRTAEAGQVVFELMTRDIRQAGGRPCGTWLIANVLCNVSRNIGTKQCRNVASRDLDLAWAVDWDLGPIQGFGGQQPTPQVAFGTGRNDRVEGTDAIVVRYARGVEHATAVRHEPESARIELRLKRPTLQEGDFVMVCDEKTAAIFQITKATYVSDRGEDAFIARLSHNAGSLNCTEGLGYPQNCNGAGVLRNFSGAFLAEMVGVLWYVGCNGRVPCDVPNGRSLYRIALEGDPDGPKKMEIIEGVWDMKIQYRLRDGTGWLEAQEVNWSQTHPLASNANPIVAVRLTLMLRRESEGRQVVERKIVHEVNLRQMEDV